MSKPRPVALDLCCGRGGWTKAFLAEGFEVIGVDIQRFKDYPAGTDFSGRAQFLWADIMALKSAIEQTRNPRALIREFRRLRVAVASPPCTEFSRHDQPGLFPGIAKTHPDMRLVDACFEIARLLDVPLVLENVRGLQKFIGSAAAHYGSFYIWGDGVPALMPKVPGRQGRPMLKFHKRSPSLRAFIPAELSQHIARYHKSLCVNRSHLNRVSAPVSARVQELATVISTNDSQSGLSDGLNCKPAAETGTTKPGLGAPRSLRSADAFDCAGSV